ncbi:hypothetical protein CCACVL1_02448 [Corchorus capsularis]|uniref:Low-density receptor-like protein n=1 Tax=Corchorus capsularis TaxID=210143 RepID=A0A1R3K8H4_COCAP|nr:hypothetical protein CCACVL1_02448 [Corchorus capsularis]
MASCFAPVSISGGSHLKTHEVLLTKSSTFGKTPSLAVRRKPARSNSSFSVSAEYRDGSRGGGSDFVAGFLLGGAVCGTLAYIFAPQIRRSLLNEDEHGFRRAKRPIYYDEGFYNDEGLEKTRQTLNAKISQLNSAIDNVSSRLRINSAIDNVSSRLRGGKKAPAAPVEADPEVEATM